MKPDFVFPDLGEFRFVSEILKDGADLDTAPIPEARRGWFSAGDDCAQFDGWLVTKDMSAEGTHFRLDWSTPEQAVEKNIVSNVSDISAMGGEARIALLGICHNKGWSATTRERVAKAFREGLSRRGIALIGGDTIAADQGLLSLTLLGAPGEAVLRRNAATEGDGLYVVGTLGKSAAGLWLLLNHPEQKDACEEYKRLVNYHLCPQIVEDAGKKLVEAGVRGACMDISDGLSSETNHLALSSGVKIEIEAEKLPIDEDVVKLSKDFGLDPLEFVLNGGEEYQLLFTSALDESIFRAKLPFSVTRIGSVTDGEGVYIKNGKDFKVLSAGAWTHL